MTKTLLRPARFDDFGLKRALADRLLPVLVGAMAFLAALALAGALAAASMARHWQLGAGSAMTVQVPRPDAPAADGSGRRDERVLATLRQAPGVASARLLGREELAALLRPWLGEANNQIALPLPAVIQLRLEEEGVDAAALAARLAAVAPGTQAEAPETWARRLQVLGRSLEACAGLCLFMVGFVAIAVVTVATRAGLASRRETIETVHGLGATDGYIARRFARRAAVLAGLGGAAGALGALPVLAGLGALARPFTGEDGGEGVGRLLGLMPAALWAALPALPAALGLIGWTTAQATVRRWLYRLP